MRRSASSDGHVLSKSAAVSWCSAIGWLLMERNPSPGMSDAMVFIGLGAERTTTTSSFNHVRNPLGLAYTCFKFGPASLVISVTKRNWALRSERISVADSTVSPLNSRCIQQQGAVEISPIVCGTLGHDETA